MTNRNFKFLLFVIAGILSFPIKIDAAQGETAEGQIKVAMRMIGHQILLQACDETSRVLAIQKEEGVDRYKIEFESAFYFAPEELVQIVDQVVKRNGLIDRYLIEVEQSVTKELVYSYIGGNASDSLIPCKGRKLPKDCYKVFFTKLDVEEKKRIFYGIWA